MAINIVENISIRMTDAHIHTQRNSKKEPLRLHNRNGTEVISFLDGAIIPCK